MNHFPFSSGPEGNPAAYVLRVAHFFVLSADTFALFVDYELPRFFLCLESDSPTYAFRQAGHIILPAYGFSFFIDYKLFPAQFRAKKETAADITGITYGIVFSSNLLAMLIDNKFFLSFRGPKDYTAVEITRFMDSFIAAQRDTIDISVK